VGAVIGGHRRFYRVYGDAVQTSIALSATAQYSQILLAESTRKLVPRALCVTRRLKMVSGAAPPREGVSETSISSRGASRW
jgi:class 3 adenylate cyclase